MTNAISDYMNKYKDSELSLGEIKKKYAQLEFQMNELRSKCDIWKNINQSVTATYDQDVKKLVHYSFRLKNMLYTTLSTFLISILISFT